MVAPENERMPPERLERTSSGHWRRAFIAGTTWWFAPQARGSRTTSTFQTPTARTPLAQGRYHLPH